MSVGIDAQSDQIIALIASHARNFNAGDDPAQAESTLYQAVLDIENMVLLGDRAVRVFRAMAYRGVQSFIEYRSVYKRTITAASPLQVRASFEGCGKIWTTLEMRQYKVLPSDWWFDLNDLGDAQWLKGQPRVSTVAGQKTQIEYSYSAALRWWAAIYDKQGTAQLEDADKFG